MENHPFTDAKHGDEFMIDGRIHLLVQSYENVRLYDIYLTEHCMRIKSGLNIHAARKWLAQRAGYLDD